MEVPLVRGVRLSQLWLCLLVIEAPAHVLSIYVLAGINIVMRSLFLETLVALMSHADGNRVHLDLIDRIPLMVAWRLKVLIWERVRVHFG